MWLTLQADCYQVVNAKQLTISIMVKHFFIMLLLVLFKLKIEQIFMMIKLWWSINTLRNVSRNLLQLKFPTVRRKITESILSGVGFHNQNILAEQSIQTIMCMAWTNLVHVSLSGAIIKLMILPSGDLPWNILLALQFYSQSKLWSHTYRIPYQVQGKSL